VDIKKLYDSVETIKVPEDYNKHSVSDVLKSTANRHQMRYTGMEYSRMSANAKILTCIIASLGLLVQYQPKEWFSSDNPGTGEDTELHCDD
jgi:hypothetical protein